MAALSNLLSNAKTSQDSIQTIQNWGASVAQSSLAPYTANSLGTALKTKSPSQIFSELKTTQEVENKNKIDTSTMRFYITCIASLSIGFAASEINNFGRMAFHKFAKIGVIAAAAISLATTLIHHIYTSENGQRTDVTGKKYSPELFK